MVIAIKFLSKDKNDMEKYVADQSHIISWDNVLVEPEGDFHMEPMWILDKREIQLQKHTIVQVNVQWKYYSTRRSYLGNRRNYEQNFPALFQDFNNTD